MEPIDYVRALIRRWPLIAVCAFVGALLAFIGTDEEATTLEVRYRATHTLLLADRTQGSQTVVGTITFAQVPVFATRGEVPAQVAEELSYDGPPAALATQVIVERDDLTGELTFTAFSTDAERAVRIADGFADATVSYLDSRQEELRQQRLVQAQDELDRLRTDVEQRDATIAEQIAERSTGTGTAVQADPIVVAERDAAVREYSVAFETYRSLITQQDNSLGLTTLERAQPVQVQEGGFEPPRTRRARVPIGAGIGALLGSALAIVADRLDARVRDRRRAEADFGAPVISEIPTLTRKQRADRLVVGPEHHNVAAEAFRSLRTSLTFMVVGSQPNADGDRVGTILVTSPSPSEGKTTVAVNLAAAFAETGRTVVLVNADFRRPIAAEILAGHERVPLPAGLSGLDRVKPDAFLVDTAVPGVRLLDLSPLTGTPGDRIRATTRLVGRLQDTADVFIIDTPPLEVTTEALEFVPLADVVLLIGRIGRTTSPAATRAGELARFGGAGQVAVAINESSTSRGHAGSYQYYERRKDQEKAREWPRWALRRREGAPSDTGGYFDDIADVDDVHDVVHDDPATPPPPSGSDLDEFLEMERVAATERREGDGEQQPTR